MQWYAYARKDFCFVLYEKKKSFGIKPNKLKKKLFYTLINPNFSLLKGNKVL